MAKLRCIRAFVGFGQSFSPGDRCDLEPNQAAEALANFSEFFVADAAPAVSDKPESKDK